MCVGDETEFQLREKKEEDFSIPKRGIYILPNTMLPIRSITVSSGTLEMRLWLILSSLVLLVSFVSTRTTSVS